MTIQEIERITDLFRSPDKDNTTVAVSYLENLDLEKDLVDIIQKKLGDYIGIRMVKLRY